MPAPSVGVFYCLSKSITGLPFDTQCMVTIFKNGNPFRIEVQDIWSGRTYVAIYSGGTVGKFVEYALKSDLWPQNPGTKITANTDMYTITTPGHYYCGENAAAASLKNCPCTEAFTLTVYRGAGGPIDGMYTIQEYTSYTGNIRITQTYNMDSKNWTVHKFTFSS